MKTIILCLALLISMPATGMAWDDNDGDNNYFIMLDKDKHGRRRKTIEIFDFDKGRIQELEVENVRRSGRYVEVEVYDPETGKYKIFEMDIR